MKDIQGLRTAIQAIGVYFLCYGVWFTLGGAVQIVLGPWSPPRVWFVSPTFTAVINDLSLATQYILIASVLLVKTDWSVKTVVGLSKPPVADESPGEG